MKNLDNIDDFSYTLNKTKILEAKDSLINSVFTLKKKQTISTLQKPNHPERIEHDLFPLYEYPQIATKRPPIIAPRIFHLADLRPEKIILLD